MLTPSVRGQVRNLTFLYLAMAHSTDNYLSDIEMETIIDRLQARFDQFDRQELQGVAMEALAYYQGSKNAMETATQAMMALRNMFSPEELEMILEDLMQIARADGIVLDDERGFLAGLAECWGIVLPGEKEVIDRASAYRLDRSRWTVLHHLAFIYLVLAHGTDNELDSQEERIMLKKLQEWQPRLTEDDVRSVYEAAKERYARGPDESALNESIRVIRTQLPEEQRMVALNDLIQIANADGFFLDDEEDLINNLMNALGVAAYANYREKGRK